MSRTKKYKSNHIPRQERLFNIAWALVLFFIAYYGFTNGSFHLPDKGALEGVTFTGNSLWLFLSAAVIGAINLLVTFADHYDKRDNESQYKLISRVLSSIAVVFAISAVTLAYAESQKEPVVIKDISYREK